MNRLCILILFNVFIMLPAFCQEEIIDTSFDQIVISANKVTEKRSNIAQQVQVIKSQYITSVMPQSSADLLQSTGEVFVQKSQQGGGSPVLRGFEASRILLVVDGVRLNNLIYRSGHLQNLVTIDPNVMDRLEVLQGPSSTVYGSDALGGVIHFKTKDPALSKDGNLLINGSVSSSYRTANNGANLNATLNIGGTVFASFTGVTLTQFGDLRMGGRKNPFYNGGYFGERPTYVDRVGGQDILVTNEDKLVQKYSGYKQIDVLQKFVYKPSDALTHSLNIQYSNSTDVPRYDRLTDVKGSGLNSAEWYYGPQKRLFSAYTMGYKSNGFFESLQLTASYQSVQESRHNRNFGSAKLNHRIEDVQVAGLQVSGLRRTGSNELRTGIDVYWNGLTSTAYQENIETNVISPLDTRYPDGKNTQWNAAAYATHTWYINDYFVLNDGVRVGVNSLNSTFANKTFFPFPFDVVKQNNFIYSGSIGLVYRRSGFKASYMSSLGFRAPNVDDLSKVFESAPGMVIVPNPDVKPETTLNNELSIGYFDKSWSIENVVYYTRLRNFISLAPSIFDGSSIIDFAGTQSQVFSSMNSAKGYIYGFYSSLRKKFGTHWSAYGSLTYTYGRGQNDGVEVPLDHISPIISKLGVDAVFDKVDATFYILSNGKKDIVDYSPSGEDNAQYAPATGMPAWMCYNVRFGYQVQKSVKWQVGVDNVLDTQYRYFASGINAPGRNIWTSLRVSF